MPGIVQQFTVNELRGLTSPSESNATLTAAVSAFRPADPERVQIVIVNTGSTDARIGFTRGVTAAQGIRLPASGGTLSLLLVEDFLLLEHAIYGVTASGSTTVWWSELRRVSDVDVGGA